MTSPRLRRLGFGNTRKIHGPTQGHVGMDAADAIALARDLAWQRESYIPVEEWLRENPPRPVRKKRKKRKAPHA